RLRLRINKLQFLSGRLDEFASRFWAYTDPIYSSGGCDRAVCLDRYFKSERLDRLDRLRIQLEERFAAGNNHKFHVWIAGPGAIANPCAVDRPRKRCCGFEFSPARSVGSDK